MEDDEYLAYLKKQSYDDLVAISYSINQESQARRYAMVLAELAERDKRGEKPKRLKDDKAICILFALIFAGMAVILLITGHFWGRRGLDVSVTDSPGSYWTIVSLQFLGAIWFVFKAFKNDKDKN